MPTRRIFLQTLLGAGLAGCAGSPTLDLFSKEIQGIRGQGPSDYPLTRAQVESIPYATLGTRVGEQATAVMVLASYNNDGLHWVSADHVTFVLKHGRLVRTLGLSRDLAATEWQAPDPLATGLAAFSSGSLSAERLINLNHPDVSNLQYRSSFSAAGHEKIAILGREYSTLHVEETVQVTGSEWSFTNHYWLDTQTGFIWRSEQRYCQQVPVIRLEVLKPAAPPPKA